MFGTARLLTYPHLSVSGPTPLERSVRSLILGLGVTVCCIEPSPGYHNVPAENSDWGGGGTCLPESFPCGGEESSEHCEEDISDSLESVEEEP